VPFRVDLGLQPVLRREPLGSKSLQENRENLEPGEDEGPQGISNNFGKARIRLIRKGPDQVQQILGPTLRVVSPSVEEDGIAGGAELVEGPGLARIMWLGNHHLGRVLSSELLAQQGRLGEYVVLVLGSDREVVQQRVRNRPPR